MDIKKRKFIHQCTAILACSCAPISIALADNTPEPLPEPTSVFGCSTLDNFSDQAEVIDFSPAQKELVDSLQFTDFGTFVFSKRWVRSDGLTPNTGKITLGCRFLNGQEAQREFVKATAKEWLQGDLGELLDFQFDVPLENSHLRIQLGGNANNSYVGRDNLLIDKALPTMNLANFNDPQTILHEFGHALGLRHEHRFPGAIKFKEDIVVSEMKKNHGWTTAQTHLNILTPLSDNAKCIGDPDLNEHSIMMYSIPKNWTESGESFQASNHITDRDRKCITGVYSI